MTRTVHGWQPAGTAGTAGTAGKEVSPVSRDLGLIAAREKVAAIRFPCSPGRFSTVSRATK